MLDTTQIGSRQQLEARKDFAFKYRTGRNLNTIRVKKGDKFWITSTSRDYRSTGIIRIHRLGQGAMETGYSFNLAQLSELFSAL